jgi:hypothetical protein
MERVWRVTTDEYHGAIAQIQHGNVATGGSEPESTVTSDDDFFCEEHRNGDGDDRNDNYLQRLSSDDWAEW